MQPTDEVQQVREPHLYVTADLAEGHEHSASKRHLPVMIAIHADGDFAILDAPVVTGLLLSSISNRDVCFGFSRSAPWLRREHTETIIKPGEPVLIRRSITIDDDPTGRPIQSGDYDLDVRVFLFARSGPLSLWASRRITVAAS